MMNRMIVTCALALLLVGSSATTFGAVQQTTAGDEAKKAGDAAKDAAKDAGKAGKHAGKATAKATKKGAKQVKKAVTGDAHATCVDGTRQAGKTEAAAAAGCANHGGVAKN